MDDTLVQIDPPERAASEPHSARRRAATVCPRCAQFFSPDGRFCPFDGEPLQAAPGWDPNADPLLGSVVDGRYRIEAVIGEGGMGVVYEARHCALDKGFALKALRKELATDAEIAARFIQEARTAASVSHPGLVEITDFGRLSTGQPYFVMELLHGQSLAALIRRGGPIPAARAVRIVRQIAEALGAAHERSIVHRDLKPDNIHISPAPSDRDRVTIVDCGVAKVIGANRMTRAGLVFGTPHYMSPEQAMGEATDHRADIYALGVVMYEMFTGRVPFEADSYMGVLTKHMYMAPTPPSQLIGTDKLGALEDITLRCLEKKPVHRYGALRELTHDLDLALHATSEQPLPPRHARVVPRSLLADELELPSRDELTIGRDPPGRPSRRGWWLAAAVGSFAACCAGVFSLRARGVREGGVARPRLAASVAVPAIVVVPGAAASAPLPAEAPSTVSPPAVPSGRLPQPSNSTKAKGSARSGVHAKLPSNAPVPQKMPTLPARSEIVDPWAK